MIDRQDDGPRLPPISLSLLRGDRWVCLNCGEDHPIPAGCDPVAAAAVADRRKVLFDEMLAQMRTRPLYVRPVMTDDEVDDELGRIEGCWR